MPDVAKHRARHEEARGLRRGSGAGRRAPSRRALWVSSLLSKKLKMSSSWLGAVWGTRSVLQALVVNGGNPRVVGAVLPPGRCSRGFSPFSIKRGTVPNLLELAARSAAVAASGTRIPTASAPQIVAAPPVGPRGRNLRRGPRGGDVRQLKKLHSVPSAAAPSRRGE